MSIVVRGSNKLVIEEAERSIHDALCVIRCLVKKRLAVLSDSHFPQHSGVNKHEFRNDTETTSIKGAPALPHPAGA